MKNIFEDELEIIEEKNDIFFTTYKTEMIDIEIAKKLVANRMSFSQGKNILVLIDGTKTKTTTKEARTFLGSKEAFTNVKAVAFFSDNPYTTFILNFIVQVHLKMNLTQTPFKIFNNKIKAINWLKKNK